MGSCVGQNQKRAENDVVAFLSQNGVDGQGFDPYLARGSGVLLFGEVTGDICDLLREVSGNGHARVLACGCATLSAECNWRLMQAGASDVMCCVECRQAAHEIIARLMRWDAVDRLVDLPSVPRPPGGPKPGLESELAAGGGSRAFYRRLGPDPG